MVFMETVRSWIRLPNRPYAALDVGAGDGSNLLALVRGTPAHVYMVADSSHAKACRKACLRAKGLREIREARTIKGSLGDVRISRDAVSVLVCDMRTGWGPPYLRRATEYLRSGGVLVALVKQGDLAGLNRLLADWYQDIRVMRLPDPDFDATELLVVLGVRRSRPQRDKGVEEYLGGLADVPPDFLEVLTPAAAPVYEPALSQPQLRVFDTNILGADDAEELSRVSRLWQQVGMVFDPPPIERKGRPITPLLSAHLAELLASGEFNGVMGRGDVRHLVAGQVIKTVDSAKSTEETEAGSVTTTVETEDFRIAVVVLTPSGEFIDLTTGSE